MPMQIIIVSQRNYWFVSSMMWPRTSSPRNVARKSTGCVLLGRTRLGPVVSLKENG